jgi:hypothetical protein
MTGVINHRSWRIGARVAAVFVAGAIAVTLGAQGPQGPGNIVNLYVSATDAKDGKFVPDLKAEEFTYSENGVAGKIMAAEKFSLPIHLTIAVDNGPGSDQSLGFYRNGLKGLVEALPDGVEIALYAMAPQPRPVVKSTTMKDAVLKGINQVAPDSENSARFTDNLVEFTQRLDKDAKDSKDKKLAYAPYLVVVSTTAAEAWSYQQPDLEKAMGNFAKYGARLSVAMTTTKNSASLAQRTGSVSGGTSASDDVQDLNNGRQALIAIPLVKATQGKYEALAQPSALQNILPEWGKMIASIHTKQANQYKLTIQRPNGATGPFNNLDMRFTRQGLNGAVSGDGRYTQ